MNITNAKNALRRTQRIISSIAITCLTLAMVLLGPAQPAAAANAPARGCVFQTYNGRYLTAVGGGGRTSDVLHTDATKIGSWEKFTLIDPGVGSPIPYGFMTSRGYYLTAVGGGGRITDVMHSNATQLQGWEQLTLVGLGGNVYAIKTYNGRYLTAVGGGGRTTDAIHSDATTIGSWEKFRVSCGH